MLDLEEAVEIFKQYEFAVIQPFLEWVPKIDAICYPIRQ